jgi:hypothetical protein
LQRCRRIELGERRAQRVEAWGAGKPVFFDGAADRCRDCGVLVVGEINYRQSESGFTSMGHR